MIIFEKLSNDNFEEFNNLFYESKNTISYQLDFYKYYDNKGFIYKYFIKKCVKLIKYYDKYIGYIWLDTRIMKSIRINNIYIKDAYLELFDRNFFKKFKSEIVVFETYENEYIRKLAKFLNMNRYKITNLMHLSIKGSVSCIHKHGVTFRTCQKKFDRKLRCSIQNSVFKNDSRVPLTVADIEYDEHQEYYLDKFCLFIMDEGCPIGYGQIIFNRGVYFIVNIGILEGYRGNGYGRMLINKLIELAHNEGINELYIRVEDNNLSAKHLYRSIGFVDIGLISNWVWNR